MGFRGAEGDLIEFVQKNVVGTLELIEAARRADVGRFVFISTCAVHEKILDDRPLDEAHPLWATSHYGAYKAAVEKFVHSYGLGHGYPICALRPTGVYGAARPIQNSKWHDLVSAVVRGETVQCSRGGKEVHAADVAKPLFGAGVPLASRFNFAFLHGIRLEELVELSLFAPVTVVIVVASLAGFRVEHGRVFPARQFHDRAGGLAAKQLGGTVHWRFQFETLARGAYGRGVADFGVDFNNVTHEIGSSW